MAPGDSLARFRKHVLDRVARGEVSVVEACRQAGISRARFYQLRHRYLAYGEAGLRPKPRPGRPDRQLPVPLQDQIVALAIELPTLGPRAISDRLRLERFGGLRVSASGVCGVLRRRGLSRRAARLAAAESLAASEGGPITERALREIRARERAHVVHLGSDVVGADLFADTMYVGKLKGVGTVWQYSFVDGACSMGFGGDRRGRKTARRMAAILEAQVVPAYREAGIAIRRISTDGGPEFGRYFTRACQRLGIVHRRLPPRSPDLNAFVERFQGTCLHEHYRVAFRYRYYTRVEDVDADFQAWRRHYNFERPHRGYRTQGRRPAEIFYAHRPELLRKKEHRDGHADRLPSSTPSARLEASSAPSCQPAARRTRVRTWSARAGRRLSDGLLQLVRELTHARSGVVDLDLGLTASSPFRSAEERAGSLPRASSPARPR